MQPSFQQCQNFIQNILAPLSGEWLPSWFWTNHMKSSDSASQSTTVGGPKTALFPWSFILLTTPAVLNRGWLSHPGNLCQCLETYLTVTFGEKGATGILWVEARRATKHPTDHRADPTAKNDPAPMSNVNSVANEKPWWQIFPWKIQVLINPEPSDSKCNS